MVSFTLKYFFNPQTTLTLELCPFVFLHGRLTARVERSTATMVGVVVATNSFFLSLLRPIVLEVSLFAYNALFL